MNWKIKYDKNIVACVEGGFVMSQFSFFDPILILFSIIIAIGFVRLLMAPNKNYFALAFTLVCLGVFIFMDILVVKTWLGQLA